MHSSNSRARLVALAVALVAIAGIRGRARADVSDDLKEGDKYYEESNWKKAAAAYDRAIKNGPRQVPPEAYGKRATIYLQKEIDDPRGGLEFIRKVAKAQYPDAPEVLEQEAILLWKVKDKDGAIVVAQKVVAKKPSTWTNQLLIGEYFANRDPAKTIVAYEAYFGARPGDQEVNDELPMIQLAIAYLARAQLALRDGHSPAALGDYEKAAKQYETLQRRFAKGKYPANIDTGLCAAYTGLGRFDQAIAVCERIKGDPRKIDANGSVWYNLAQAYLSKKLPAKAREAANRFREKKPDEARAYILLGDAYFLEKDWQQALDNYLKADQKLRANQGPIKASLSIKMGKTYRRMPFAGTGPNPNLANAIDKLEGGLEANPDSRELAIELGNAYLAARRDKDALTRADNQIGRKDFTTATPDEATELYLVSAKAQYNLGKLAVARQRFEAAVILKPKDVSVRRGLVETINAQAWSALDKNDSKAAQDFLDQAAQVDTTAPMTALNMAVLAIDRGDCDGALRQLDKLKGNRRGYALVYERLTGRAYLCGKKPDKAKAAEHYAAANTEAQKLSANLILAEIYTEWGPLLIDSDLDDAVEKLSSAVTFSAQSPDIGNAAKRNLALALFRRGWRSIKAGKATDAAADFERATRDPGLLKGTEPMAFEFSYGIALLDKGDNVEAGKIFKSLATRGNQSAYLKAPYNKVGGQFFGAYADYKSGNPQARTKAAGEFTALQSGATGAFAQKLRDLIASSYEYVAYDEWRAGRGGAAAKALDSAAKFADESVRRRVVNDRAALNLGKDDLNTLQGLGDDPPEALVNLGILYDQAGRPKDAYDAWTRAKAKGAQAHDLQKWIDAKKRFYGF